MFVPPNFRPAKFLLAAMMLTEAAIAWNDFSGWYVAIFVLAGAMFFAAAAGFEPDRYPIWFSRAFFVGSNIIALITMHLIWRFGVFQLSI